MSKRTISRGGQDLDLFAKIFSSFFLDEKRNKKIKTWIYLLKNESFFQENPQTCADSKVSLRMLLIVALRTKGIFRCSSLRDIDRKNIPFLPLILIFLFESANLFEIS